MKRVIFYGRMSPRRVKTSNLIHKCAATRVKKTERELIRQKIKSWVEILVHSSNTEQISYIMYISRSIRSDYYDRTFRLNGPVNLNKLPSALTNFLNLNGLYK